LLSFGCSGLVITTCQVIGKKYSSEEA